MAGLRVRPYFVLLILLTMLPAVNLSQSASPLTEETIRTFTREAEAEAMGDNNALVRGVDKRVRALVGDFESFPIYFESRDDISIMLLTPYMSYRMALIERLRRMEPSNDIPWEGSAVIRVGPKQIDSPDIIRIVVQRDGKQIPPLKTLLTPREFKTRIGAATTIHAGDVLFPMTAFSPGATVTITAIPNSGINLVQTLQTAQLERLK